jgi:hypothetical protein
MYVTYAVSTETSVTIIQTYTTQTSLNFPAIFLALRGRSVRHYIGTTRSVFERVGLPAVQGKCLTDMQYGGLYGRLYVGFVRMWKWTLSQAVISIFVQRTGLRR